MSHETLRRKYETGREKAMHEAAVRRIVLEANRERLIVEKFDPQTLKAVVSLVTRVKGIDFRGLESLEQARNAAVQDASKALGNMGTGSFINRVKSLFGKGDPLADPLSFMASMNSLFGDMKKYLEALGAKPDDKRSVKELINGSESSDESTKQLLQIIATGLKPSKGASKWTARYLKKNVKEVAQEIADMPASNLMAVADSAEGATKNAQAAQQAAAGAGAAASHGTEPTSGTKPTSGTGSTQSTGETDGTKHTSGTGETQLSDDDRKKVIAQARKTYDDIKHDFGNMDPKTVEQVLAVLAYNNRLK